MGRLKEAHANNDKISAVRIGKAFLAGTAKEVWVPDRKTQEWRDWFHAYTKATKRTTQMQARLRSYLSDNGVHAQLGFQLEYQEGTIAQHYHCVREDLSEQEIVEVLCDYLAGDVFWKRGYPFECRDLRTPSYRAGFWVGRALGKIATFCGFQKG